MRHKNVGGRRRRSWRLKKKHSKWFFKVMLDITNATLQDLPQNLFGMVHSLHDYEFIRLYKPAEG
jgi:hypothetical protein